MRMRPQIASSLGVAGGTFGILALFAYAYAATLPYRITPTQSALLGVVLVVQLVGPALALALGAAALRGDRCGRRFGFIAVAFGMLGLLLAMLTSHVHSVSHW